MEINELVKVGMANEVGFEVGQEHSAVCVGSGSLEVLASPVMIAYMERAACDLLAGLLPQSYSSVGVQVDVSHLAASPLGSRIRVSCEVLGVEGRRVDFAVQAWDEHEKIGQGTHQRAVIEVERFLRRVAAKQ